MRINQVEKSLKHILKRKVSVNQAVVVGFLIMGMGAFAADINIDAEDMNSQITVSGPNVSIDNYGTISSTTTSGNNSGNGIVANAGTAGNSIGDIMNVGIISGKAGELGNGIAHANTTGDAIGNGIIQNNTDASTRQGMGNVENTGYIKGSVILKSVTSNNALNGYGNGIAVSNRNSTSGDLVVGDITNTSGIISGNFQTDGKVSNNMRLRGVGNGIGVSITSNNGTATAMIGKVENHGRVLGNVEVESGNMEVDSRIVGNGVGFSSANPIGDRKNLDTLVNTGVISGNVEIEADKLLAATQMWLNGNGVGGMTTTAANGIRIGDISNDGIISGNMDVEVLDDKVSAINGRAFGNGIIAYTGSTATASIGNINNTGKVVGNYVEDSPIELAKANNSFGNGVYSSGSISSIKNTGLIAGSNHAIYADSVTGEISNYGILAGNKITNKALKKTNYGVEITLNTDGTVNTITNGTSVDPDQKVINATIAGKDSSINVTTDITDGSYDNAIINGAGVSSGTIAIADGKKVNMTGSTVNAYQTAIHLAGNGTLNASNTTFNGGGLKGESTVINGVGGKNNISLTGNSVINGNIALAGGDNTLSMDSTTKFNGDKISATGNNNTLNLGNVITTKTEEPNLVIYGEIDGFQDLNIKGNVTLFETAKLTGTDNIDISKDGDLTVRIDSSLGKEEGEYRGHALYDTGASITGTGNLTFGVAGISAESLIGLGDTEIKDFLGTIQTDSLGREINIDKDGNLVVEIDSRLPGELGGTNHQYLSKMWASILESGQISELDPTILFGYGNGKTKEEAIEALDTILESLFIGNLATASSNVTRQSMNRFNEVAVDNPFTPKKSQLLVDGGAIYNGGESNFKFPDTADFNGKSDVEYNMFNAYGKVEYGITDRTSVGTIFGGGNSKIENDFGSDLDGNSAYLGLYAKHKTNFWNWDLYTGAGYQYTDYEGTKVSGNQFQTIRNDQDFSVKGYTLYAGARKSIELARGFMWEPKAKITYTSLKQDEINESGDLAMNIESRDTSYLETEFGANLRRDFNFKSGVGRARVGVAWNILLDDHLAETMDASFAAGGDSFELLVPQNDRSRVKFDLAYEFEKPTGWSYSVGATFGSGKITDDFTARAGVGYKF